LKAYAKFNSSGVAFPPGQTLLQATTTITLTSTTSVLTLGDTVTLTAVVSSSGAGTPTGSVTFFDGTIPLGTGNLIVVGGNDQATFSTALLASAPLPGTHSITAIYNGDTNFTVSPLSSAVSERVQRRASTTAVAVNPTAVVVGQTSTATVTVTDAGSSNPPGNPDSFTPTGVPATGRTGFTSTLFADGQVLVAGGTDVNGNVLPSAEIYSVLNGAFAPANGTLNVARTGAHALLLANGKVLVAGGSSDGTANGALQSAELFDPVSGTFTATSHNLTAARFGFTATMLASGQVLLAGGENSGGVLNSAELYDPAADTFTATGNLNTARTGAVASLLRNSTVLIAGGSSDGTANGALNSAELFDASGNNGAGAFTLSAATMSAARWQAEATFLLDTDVLIAGGQNASGVLNSFDLYNPDQFISFASHLAQARAGGSVVTLPNGKALLAGGTATSPAGELFDFDGANDFEPTGSLQQSDTGLVLTLLNNGQVLAVGLTSGASPQPDAELYSPSFNPLGDANVASFGNTFCLLAPVSGSASDSSCSVPVSSPKVANPLLVSGRAQDLVFHSPSTGSTNLTVSQATTTTTITANTPSPSVTGQPISVSVVETVNSPGVGTPTGTVTVSDGAGQTCSTIVPSGSCSITPPAAGSYTLTAQYSGDTNFTASTSAGVPQTVNDGNSVTTVSSSQNPSAVGQSVTFTATVSPVSPATGVPMGTVTFLDKGSSIGKATLNNGVATFSTSNLAAGNHTIAAGYGGDANFTVSTGNLFGNPQVVVGPPSIGAIFTPAAIAPGGVSSLSFAITNPAANTVAGIGVAFADVLPTNVLVATPNGLTNTCGGTATAAAGGTNISLTGGSLAVNTSCTVTVNVTTTVVGSYSNTSGAVSSTNGGTGNTTSAVLMVQNAGLSITKTHSGNFPVPSSNQGYTITVSNSSSAGATNGTVTVIDTLPNVANTFVPTAMSGTGWTCTLGTVTCTRNDSLAPGASFPSITLTVNVPSGIPGNVINSATVTGGGDPISHTADDPTHIGQPIQVTLPSGNLTVNPGNTQSMTMTVNSSAGEGTVNFSCSGLPAGGSCSFNPPSTNQLTTQVAVGITVPAGTAAGVLPTRPLYAALVPLLGLAGLVLGRKKSNKTAPIRLALLTGLALSFALLGCGGGQPVPGGHQTTFQVAVTATSASTGDSGSSVITLTVP
jgi:uncharacterized repeat protein (TIGR01451 family)